MDVYFVYLQQKIITQRVKDMARDLFFQSQCLKLRTSLAKWVFFVK